MTYRSTLSADRLFNHLMSDPFDAMVSRASGATRLMSTDIKETDTAYELQIELPGFKKEDVSAVQKDGYLEVSAKTSSETTDEGKAGTYLRKERFAGSCSRTFYVGDDVEQSEISAKFDSGVLIITVPKKAPEPEVEESFSINID